MFEKGASDRNLLPVYPLMKTSKETWTWQSFVPMDLVQCSFLSSGWLFCHSLNINSFAAVFWHPNRNFAGFRGVLASYSREEHKSAFQ